MKVSNTKYYAVVPRVDGSINNLSGGMGGADNYSYDELQELGKEFLNK